VDEAGRPFHLRGMCLGGWLNTENFINGYPFTDHALEAGLRKAIGDEMAEYYMDRQREYHFRQEDADFLAECGTTAVRIPFNYRLIESDTDPGIYCEAGARWLDRGIEHCKRAGLYAILDLHAAQGWQNPDWHCDNPADVCLLWGDKNYQDRLVGLWGFLAARYKDEPAVAGYEIMNEPTAPDMETLNALHERAARRIRQVDGRHMIFFEGNIWGVEFEGFRVPDENGVAACHIYIGCDFERKTYPNKDQNPRHIAAKYANRLEFAREAGVPMWCGEWGALHNKHNSPTKAIAEGRIRAVDDQASHFESVGHGWAMWTYKDVGVMGLAQMAPGSAYLKRTASLQGLKRAFGTDGWGRTSRLFEKTSAAAAGRFNALLKGARYSGTRERLGFLVRRKISDALGLALIEPFAKQFVGMTKPQMDRMMQSWKLESCRINKPLADVLRKHAP